MRKNLKIIYQDFLNHDIHIHLPSGAVPKDGPSAGVAICLAIASVLSDRPVRNDIAMTGEVSLRGRVLPIDGVREKVSAACRVGINTVILPKENKKDLQELPESLGKQMNFIFVERVEEVFKLALLNYQEQKLNLDFLKEKIQEIVIKEKKIKKKRKKIKKKTFKGKRKIKKLKMKKKTKRRK